MIQIQGSLERDVLVACSGGVDSMAAVDFLRRNHNITLVFFDHGTDTSKEALSFLETYVKEKNSEFSSFPNATRLKLEVGKLSRKRKKNESKEEFWRNERYQFFHSFDSQVVTCHHLDDCVETWIWSSLHGEGKIIPYRNSNVIRPFRLNRKTEFVNWCRRHNVPWVEDETNEDIKYMRNFIRHELLTKALVVNPGLHKVIKKKVNKDEYF